MTYASGGLIQASDFNNLNGASAGSTGGGTQMNPVWATGQGQYGYGQTAISNVSVGGTVAATNWASLINSLNNARTHQSGSGSGISAPTAGSTVTYLSTLSSAISTAATNRFSNAIASSGSVSTTKSLVWNAAAGVASDQSVTFTITAPSVDQMRYFWNAGGYVRVYFVSSTNTGGTSRGTSMVTLFGTNYVSKIFKGVSSQSRTGTGGTLTTDNTSQGFWSFSGISTTEWTRITSTSYYTGDFMTVSTLTNGVAGSYGGNGSVVYLTVRGYSATTGSTQPPDSINTTIVVGCLVQYPEATYLSNSWGTFTVT